MKIIIPEDKCLPVLCKIIIKSNQIKVSDKIEKKCAILPHF